MTFDANSVQPAHVLVVDDEPAIAALVARLLENEGYRVSVARSGEEAIEMAQAEPPDLVVLDVTLPRIDGLEVCRRLRTFTDAYVLMLTARAEEFDQVVGLSVGADDYLTKPFFVEELVARLHAVTRRGGERTSVLEHDGLRANLLTREVSVQGAPVELTTREFTLLEYLLRAPGRVFTRTQILEHVWGYDFDPATNLVDVHIQRLRKKLFADDRERYIETVRGVGYRFRKEA